MFVKAKLVEFNLVNDGTKEEYKANTANNMSTEAHVYMKHDQGWSTSSLNGLWPKRWCGKHIVLVSERRNDRTNTNWNSGPDFLRLEDSFVTFLQL